ncbi:heterokaryon incompatibility protein-domain-containing protein [Dendryphion nanum]|uniref:Heterokaryon incompatibility protein-domain-containing protein n=1 Tax=Dendryphion nanum TaxID=256645 RepID=A0A9P9EER3_9PLEO|nr:heterokaryon incompatibility protein-domain-containing protein [Dendryphion nanum]
MASSSRNNENSVDWLSKPGYNPDKEADMAAFVHKYANMDMNSDIEQRRQEFAAMEAEGDAMVALINKFLPPELQYRQETTDALLIDIWTEEAYTFEEPGEPTTLQDHHDTLNSILEPGGMFKSRAPTSPDKIAKLHWKYGDDCTNESDRVCTVCASIRFERQLCVSKMTHASYGVNLAEAWKNINCPMCRLLIACISKHPSVSSPPWGDDTMILLRLETFTSATAISLKNNQTAVQSFAHPRRFYATLIDGKTFEGQGKSFVTRYPAVDERYGIQLVRSPVPDPRPYSWFGLGKKMRTTHLDYSLLKAWDKKCFEEHGPACKRHTGTQSGLPFEGFRVIDVKERRVITAPEGCSYVALSYVWGKTKQLRNTKETRQRLMSPNGLDPAFDDISPGIKDAMMLCAQFSRYLWVDALCIWQDEKEDKSYQIQNMDQVYLCAALTIVAASAPGAHCPLPGVRPKSRSGIQHLELVGNVILSNIQPQFRPAVSASPWHSRGWTLQEYNLSKRMLILTEDQAFWHCGSATWYEDAELEVEPPTQNGFRHEGLNLEEKGAWETYKALADSYVSRDLTEQSDAENCVQGILNQLEPKLGKFFHAVPESHLPGCILWDWPRHREDIEFERRRHFPTWSWVTYAVPLNTIGTKPKPVLSEAWYQDSRTRMRMGGDTVCATVEYFRYTEDGMPVKLETSAYQSLLDPEFVKYLGDRVFRPVPAFRIQFYATQKEGARFASQVTVPDRKNPGGKKKGGLRALFRSKKDKKQDKQDTAGPEKEAEDQRNAIINRGIVLHIVFKPLLPRMLGFWAETMSVCIFFPDPTTDIDDPRCTISVDAERKHILGKCLLSADTVELARAGQGEPIVIEVAVVARDVSSGPHLNLPRKFGWYYHGIILHRCFGEVGTHEGFLAEKIGVVRDMDADVWHEATNQKNWQHVLLV